MLCWYSGCLSTSGGTFVFLESGVVSTCRCQMSSNAQPVSPCCQLKPAMSWAGTKRRSKESALFWHLNAFCKAVGQSSLTRKLLAFTSFEANTTSYFCTACTHLRHATPSPPSLLSSYSLCITPTTLLPSTADRLGVVIRRTRTFWFWITWNTKILPSTIRNSAWYR